MRHATALATIGGVVTAVLIIVVVFAVGNPSARESFLANFAATVAGIALGLPIAVWTGLRSVRAEQEVAASAASAEAARRRRRVLDAVRAELEIDREKLNRGRGPGARGIVGPGLEDGLWTALSQAGDTSAIDDPALLAKIVDAYTTIRVVRELEGRWIALALSPPRRDGKAAFMGELEQMLAEADVQAARYVDAAIAAIEEATATP